MMETGALERYKAQLNFRLLQGFIAIGELRILSRQRFLSERRDILVHRFEIARPLQAFILNASVSEINLW